MAEAHSAILAGEDVLSTDDGTVEVTSEVDQGLLPAANRFAMRHPFPWMARRQANAGRLDRRQHFCPKDLGHRFLVEQIGAVLAAPLASPPLLRRIDRRGDAEMDMRVEVEPTRGHVPYRDRPGVPLARQ